LPNVGPYIYDVSISGFTRSSIYIYDISSLRVKIPNRPGRSDISPSKCKPRVSLHVINGSSIHNHKLQFGVHTMFHYME